MSAQSVCYNAVQTITIAGAGSFFIVQNGGAAEMIAGAGIFYLPGTTVYSGGYMWGHIAPTGPWCGSASALAPVASREMEEQYDFPMTADKGKEGFFKLYPNPTTGTVTLELSEEPGEEPVIVKMYNMMGMEILETEITDGRFHQFSLATWQTGVYLVKAMKSGEMGFWKIVKQ
jgi:hypothetical protein